MINHVTYHILTNNEARNKEHDMRNITGEDQLLDQLFLFQHHVESDSLVLCRFPMTCIMYNFMIPKNTH